MEIFIRKNKAKMMVKNDLKEKFIKNNKTKADDFKTSVEV